MISSFGKFGMRWALMALCGLAATGGLLFVVDGGLSGLVSRPLEQMQPEKRAREAGREVGQRTGEIADRARDAGRDAARAPGGLLDRTLDTRSTIAAAIWHAVRLPLALLAGLLAALVASRARVRRRRSYGLWELVPHEGETGRSGSITDTWDAINHALQERWWRRLVGGQHAICLGIENVTHPETGAWRTRLVLQLLARKRLVETIESALCSTYEHLRLEAIALSDEAEIRRRDVLARAHVVRVKRGRSFFKGRLATPVVTADGEEGQSEFTVDRLVAAMRRMKASAYVQYAMWPVPGIFERFAHWVLRARENDRGDEVDPGGPSAVTREELEGTAEGIAHRPLFFGDIRIATTERELSERLAAIVCGSIRRGEGKLVRRHTHLRASLYRWRMEHGQGNPVPGWLRGVYASAELAALWRLPNVFRNAGRVESHPMPRLAPPAGVRRVPAEEGILVLPKGEGDPGVERGLAIWPEDWRSNLGILGALNAGKSTAMRRAGTQLVRDRNRCLFFIDPKGEDWQKFLAALRTNKPVYVLDFTAPEVGFSPLRGSAPIAKKKASLAAGMLEMFRTESGESQMYQASLSLLDTYAEALLELFERPDFHDLADALSSSQAGYAAREWLQSEVAKQERTSSLLEEMNELQAQLKDARAAFTQRLAAPRNKISRLRGDPMVQILHHPNQIDLETIIEQRAVLVVNGGLGPLDMEPMRGLVGMLLVMICSAALAQLERPEDERADISLLLDEAHFFLGNEYVKTALATARAAGLSWILAFQHLGQLDRKDDLRALTSLIRSWIFFRVAPDDAADVSNLLQQVHLGGHSAKDDHLERLTANPRALSAATQYWALGTFVVRGTPSSGFTGMVERLDGERAQLERYLERQRAHGARKATFEEIGQASRPWHTADEQRRRRGEESEEEDGELVVSKAVDGGDQLALGAPEPAETGGAGEDASSTRRGGGGRRSAGDGEAATVAEPAPTPLPANLPQPSKALRELDRYEEVTGIRYEDPVPAPSPKARRDGTGRWAIVEGTPQPDAVQLAVLAEIELYRFLAQFQIAERYYESARSARRSMQQLVDAGLVQRFVVTTRAKGRDPSLYGRTRAGFELLKLTSSRHGAYLPADASWEEDDTVVARQPGQRLAETEWEAEKKRKAVGFAHDIGVISWAHAFEDLAENCVRRPLAKRQCYQLPPARRERREGKDVWVPKTPQEIGGLGKNVLANLDFKWGAVRPDVGFEIEIEAPSQVRRFDLFVEYERTAARNEKLRDKLRNYDAFLVGGHREKERYREFGEPPVALFVVPDWETAYRYALVADEVFRGAVRRGNVRKHRWKYEGRRRVFFTAAPFVHQRTTLAYSLIELPPDVRGELETNPNSRRAARAPQAGEVVEFLPPTLLKNPTRLAA